MAQLSPLLIMLLAFGAVTAAVFVIGQYVVTQARLQRRTVSGNDTDRGQGQGALDGVHALVTTYFDEKRFQMEGPAKAKLRRDLIRAGFFRLEAVNYYIFAKLAAVLVFPLVAYVAVEIFLVNYGWPVKLLIVAVALMIGFLGPDAYIARRQRTLAEKYRIVFPDVLDLMVVCVDAGLSLEAAFDRLSGEVTKRSREFGTNLLLLGAETRAGRTTADALVSFSERLGLDEARAFVAMLCQSIELGTDVGAALRVYSDEMRDRRLLRAEERANQLPVKMVLPLGLFIFPVILGLVLIPVLLRLMSVLN
jgi:tight adherence protein C